MIVRQMPKELIKANNQIELTFFILLHLKNHQSSYMSERLMKEFLKSEAF